MAQRMIYPKIDIYIYSKSKGWIYVASTNRAKTCKEAADRYARLVDMPRENVKARFAV